MDYNTFERAFRVLSKHSLEEMKVAEVNIAAILSELISEKRELSNEIRMTTAYYHVNVVKIEEEIKKVEEEIPKLAERVKQLEESAIFPTTQAKAVWKLRTLRSKKEANERRKDDFNNRVERLNNDLVDLYIEEEEIIRRNIDIKNAILLYRRAEDKNVFVDRDKKPNAKDTFVFFQKIGIIPRVKGE